ncbi:hypothetical protein SASPL_148945 [Salvia splendens]|uniref:Secreted protein n=1 Tax=Salvia splendens TaxID=180675 RepID=A0A8X8WAA5_SALSN|nr:hypothetical protein SASPL_148945 [Salvia splendens]
MKFGMLRWMRQMWGRGFLMRWLWCSSVAATRRAVGPRVKTGYKVDMPSDNLAGTRVAGSKNPEASHKNKGQHYEVAEILRIDRRCGLRERADSAHVGVDIQDGGRDILTRNRASAGLNQNSAAVARDQVYKVPNLGFSTRSVCPCCAGAGSRSFLTTLILSLIHAAAVDAKKCSPSACGVIRDISSPFRLKGTAEIGELNYPAFLSI